MKTFSVVYSKGPLHLFDDEKDLTSCGRIAPGLETRIDNSTLHDDGFLSNSSHGEWWPENPDEFCKTCLKRANVAIKLTKSKYIKIFSNERSTD